jgi:hypothetical protein
MVLDCLNGVAVRRMDPAVRGRSPLARHGRRRASPVLVLFFGNPVTNRGNQGGGASEFGEKINIANSV